MSSGSACWILWLTPMDWLALSIGRSGSQPLEYSLKRLEPSDDIDDELMDNISLILTVANGLYNPENPIESQ